MNGGGHIDLRRLRYFVAAAEESSFHRAALRLNTNQSVISKHVRDIEEELGADLFRREPGHGAQLTEVGRVFLGDVRAMFDDLDRAKMAALAVANGRRGRLRLAASEDVMTSTLARIISAYRDQWPEVHFDLRELPAIAQIRALQRGRIDLGLMLPPVEEATVISDVAWSDSLLAALPEAHTLAGRADLHGTDFDGHDVIVGHPERGPRCGRHVLDLLDALHVNVRIVAEVEHLQTALMLVQSGTGIAFVPGALVDVSIAGIVFRPFAPATGRVVVHAVWPDAATSGLVAQFLRVAHAVMACKWPPQGHGNGTKNPIRSA
ncbi:MAG: LysR family transcriptional regulator [Rhizobiales bacterium]|nr:LysR family transcriptional regulator [Hyphomicrobiales bacterium]